VPRDAARIPGDEAVRRDEEGDTFEEGAVLGAEGSLRIGVDVDLADDPPLVGDGHDDLASGRGEAREVPLVGGHVVDDLRPAVRRGRSADPATDRDPHVPGRLWTLPRSQDEVVAFDEVDAHPGVVVDAVVENLDRLPQDLVGLRLAVDDPIDGVERAPVRVGRYAQRT
jgi:hypothetical protein